MKATEIRHKRLATYQRVFSSPDGKAILEDLTSQFGGTTLRKVNGVIDANASLAAAGCREVLLYIEQMSQAPTTENPPDAMA